MTVSISNVSPTWFGNTNTYIGIGINVVSVSNTENSNTRILSLKYKSNTSFDVDANGIYFSKTTTVANLPSSIVVGSRSFVTDANTATFNNRVFTGGSNSVPVFFDGTYWKIG